MTRPKHVTVFESAARVRSRHAFASTLRAERDRVGMTARELAEIVGVSQGTVTSWEGAIVLPQDGVMALRIGLALRVDVGQRIASEFVGATVVAAWMASMFKLDALWIEDSTARWRMAKGAANFISLMETPQ